MIYLGNYWKHEEIYFKPSKNKTQHVQGSQIILYYYFKCILILKSLEG